MCSLFSILTPTLLYLLLVFYYKEDLILFISIFLPFSLLPSFLIPPSFLVLEV